MKTKSPKKPKKRTYKPGDTVMIKVGGEEFPTIIDKGGVQRFIENTAIDYLFNHDSLGNLLNGPRDHDRRCANLNQMSIDYQRGKFTKRDWMLFNMMLGYSVCGFAELSAFQDLEIENPVWD